jgi:hypothetical protein
MTVPLAPGEPLYTTDQGFLYIGNGTTLGGVQVTGYQDENAVDAVGAALVAGQNQNITFIYGQTQDVNDRIDAVLDLSVYSGEISADGFRGSVFADNSTLLINAVAASVNLDGTVKGDIVPDQNETYDIGSSSNRFRDLYLSGSSLYLGNAQITASGSAVNLPAGSTIGGSPFPVSGDDFQGNIIADDSTIMVNTFTQQIFAENGFVGDLTGNVTGDLLGNVTGNVFGNFAGNIIADDSTIMVNTFTQQIFAENGFVGDLLGNVTGSVFGFNSSVILNVDSQSINLLELNIDDVSFNKTGDKLVIDANLDKVIFKSSEINFNRCNVAVVNFIESSPTPEDPITVNQIGHLSYRGDDDNLQSLQLNDQVGIFSNSAFVEGSLTLKSLIITSIEDDTETSNNFPSKIDFIIHDYQGNYTGASLNSRGVFNSPVIQTGVYDDATDRDTRVGTPSKGMIIFNDDTGKFQGFDGSTWVDLN